jgi:hypothetical protein
MEAWQNCRIGALKLQLGFAMSESLDLGLQAHSGLDRDVNSRK